MRTAGALLMAVGLLIALAAFQMDTSVFSGSYVSGDSIVNLGLLQKQMMLLHTGLAAFIAGAVLTSGSERRPADGSVQMGNPPAGLREDETEEEREERVAGVRRVNIVMGSICGAIIILIVALVLANQ